MKATESTDNEIYKSKIKTEATECAEFKDMACKYSRFRIKQNTITMEHGQAGPSGPKETKKQKLRTEKNERIKENEREFHCKF